MKKKIFYILVFLIILKVNYVDTALGDGDGDEEGYDFNQEEFQNAIIYPDATATIPESAIYTSLSGETYESSGEMRA